MKKCANLGQAGKDGPEMTGATGLESASVRPYCDWFQTQPFSSRSAICRSRSRTGVLCRCAANVRMLRAIKRYAQGVKA